ncbi:olfactory receptor 2M3-like protein, partial [Cricetulus griseus]
EHSSNLLELKLQKLVTLYPLLLNMVFEILARTIRYSEKQCFKSVTIIKHPLDNREGKGIPGLSANRFKAIIIASYTRVILAVIRMASAESRHKAFATCSSHLVVVFDEIED